MNNNTSLSSFCQSASEILQMESVLTGHAIDPEFAKKINAWNAGIFRIVVMGEIKKGKSSFINALLGYRELVPTSSDVATSTIFKIGYGPDIKYKVFFSPSSGKTPLVINAADINRYGTEDGNPGNREQVNFIQVFCPAPLLQAGLVMIDTPGLGGLFKQHKRITYEYVPKADAVFLVTDSVESPIEKKELDLLSDLRKVTKHIFFVQTKSRLVEAEARDARRTNNLRILTEQARFDREKIKYFVVDSQTKFAADADKDIKKLERSGFDKVAAFMSQSIRPNVHRLVMDRARLEMLPHLQTVARILDDRQRTLSAKTEVERKALLDQLAESQRELAEWERGTGARLREKIETGLHDIRKRAVESLNMFRPQGTFYQSYEARIEAVENVSMLQDLVDELQVKLPGDLTEQLHEICASAQKESNSLLAELSDMTGASMTGASKYVCERKSVEPSAMMSVSSTRQTLATSSLFNSARTTVYGGMAGAAIASVVGGIVGSIIPVVGTVLGSTAGMLIAAAWGGNAALQFQNQQQLQAAKAKAKSLLSGWLSNCYADMQTSFSDTFEEIKRRIVKSVSEAIANRKEESAARIAELKATSQRSEQETQAAINELTCQRKAYRVAAETMGAIADDDSVKCQRSDG